MEREPREIRVERHADTVAPRPPEGAEPSIGELLRRVTTDTAELVRQEVALARAEMRQSLGTAVFFGMLGVTFFGLVFTPVFYVVSTGLSELRFRWRKPEVQPEFKPDQV